MSIDNPGDFFRAENFGQQNNDDEVVTILGNLLFSKSIDILNLCLAICDLLPEEEDGISTKSLIMQNATAIPAKIKGAMAMDIYHIRMENAVIIKVNFMELKDQIWVCREMHGVDPEYTEVFAKELRCFKALFIRWIQNFDKIKDLPDSWRIFNDPASFPEDKPFNNEDSFDNFNPDEDV